MAAACEQGAFDLVQQDQIVAAEIAAAKESKVTPTADVEQIAGCFARDRLARQMGESLVREKTSMLSASGRGIGAGWRLVAVASPDYLRKCGALLHVCILAPPKIWLSTAASPSHR